MNKLIALTLLTATASLAACDDGKFRTSLTYNFTALELSKDGEYYEHYVDMHGGGVSLGCFVVEARPLNCVDQTTFGPNLRPAVVQCECPCDAPLGDFVCKDEAGNVTFTVPDVHVNPQAAGHDAPKVVGMVDQPSGTITGGGAQFNSIVLVEDATSSYVTVHPVGKDETVIMRGDLIDDGTIQFGHLSTSSGLSHGSADVAIMVNRDGEEI